MSRRGASGDDDEICRAHLLLYAVVHQQTVIVQERGRAGEQIHMVPLQLSAKNLRLGLDHMTCPQAQVVHRDVALDRIAHPIHGFLPQSCQVNYGFAQRLAGNGSRVEADATQHIPLFNNGDFLPQLRSLDRCIMPSRPASDDDDVIRFHSLSSVRTMSQPRPGRKTVRYSDFRTQPKSMLPQELHQAAQMMPLRQRSACLGAVAAMLVSHDCRRIVNHFPARSMETPT